MSEEPPRHDHGFRIYPLAAVVDKNPLGVQNTKPAAQNVTVSAAVQHWKFHKTGDKQYQLRVNGYDYAGVNGDNVIASTNAADDEVWEVRYHEFQDAYTITLAKDTTRAWSTPTALSLTDRLTLAPLVQSNTHPPQFIARQLFQFVRDD